MDFLKGRNGWIVLFICLIVAGLIFRKNKHSKSDVIGTTTAPLAIGPKQKISDRSEQAVLPSRPGIEARQYNAMMATGLREIPTMRSNDFLHMKLRAAPTPNRCSLGEYDLLKGMTKSLNKQLFLLTIEPLGGAKEPVYRKRLSLGDFSTRGSLDVKLPLSANARDYGVYMCIDPEGANECGKKKALESREWNEAMNRTSNRIFYFQVISVKNDRVFLIPANNWDKGNLKKIKENLGPILESKDSIDTLQSYLEKMSPIPARVQKNILELPVSFRDPSC